MLKSPKVSYIKGDKVRNFEPSSFQDYPLYNNQHQKDFATSKQATMTNNSTYFPPPPSSSGLEGKKNDSSFQSDEFILRKKISVVRPTVNSVHEAYIPGGI